MKDILCATCLAIDGNLIPLESEIFGILHHLMVQKGYNELRITHKVCWECFAQLNNVRKFQNKALDSLRRLQGYCNKIEDYEYTTDSRTTLSVTKLNNINILNDLDASDEDILKLNKDATEVSIKLEEYEDTMFVENDDCDMKVNTLKSKNGIVQDEQSMNEDTPKIQLNDLANIKRLDLTSPCGEVKPRWRLQMSSNELLPTYRENEFNTNCPSGKTCRKKIHNDVKEELTLTENENITCTSSEVHTNIDNSSSTKLPPKKSGMKRKKHTSKKPFKCHLCKFKAVQNSDLIKHVRKHTGEKPFKCHLCEYKATHKSLLNLHIRTHTGEKPYKCHLCDFKAVQKSDLTKHMRKHTNEKPYKCHLCEYKATRKSSLNIHIRTHTGEKPYTCHLCDFKAVQNSDLIKHMRKHTSDKPFKCHLCEYKAKVKRSLKLHIRTHTDENPYK